MNNRTRSTNLRRRSALLAIACLSWLSSLLPEATGSYAAAATPASQEALLVEAIRRGGVTVLIRHSETDPGAGDPPGFRLSDCATQRNLNDAGRAQARRLGRWFEVNGIRPTVVRASPWCRTRETAMLAFGRSEDWNALSNLLSDSSRQPDQTQEVRAGILAGSSDRIEVLISHGVSISAFVDVYLQQGEMVVVRRAGVDSIEVVGRLRIP